MNDFLELKYFFNGNFLEKRLILFKQLLWEKNQYGFRRQIHQSVGLDLETIVNVTGKSTEEIKGILKKFD